MSTGSYVRSASHAGSWYESNGSVLERQLQDWLTVASSEIAQRNVRAIIAPHAGFSYSGPTSAYAYSSINPRDIKRVFVLGPSHHVYITKPCISNASTLDTPLGSLVVDAGVRTTLQHTRHFDLLSSDIDEDEHSIEMHLPYVAKIMRGNSDYTVVPIMIGEVTSKSASTIADALLPYFLDPVNLFVISSDFCHWGKRFRYQPHDASKCKDQDGFRRYLESTKNTICGRNPITVLLALINKSPHNYRTKFVRYAQSSAVRNINDSSVSYASAVVELI